MAEELRIETKGELNYLPPKLNITKDEAKSFKDLRQDNNTVMFTIDKVVALVTERIISIKPWTFRWTVIDLQHLTPTNKHQHTRTIKVEEGLGNTTDPKILWAIQNIQK